MTTKPKEGAQGKERRTPSPSMPAKIDSPQGRRTPRSSVAASPGKDNSSPSTGKPTPNYLKSTASSTHDPNKPAKKPALNSQPTKSLTRRKSMDKLPSPSQTQKTPTSASPKEKPLKPSSPSPRTVSSPKPISDKTPGTRRSGRSQQPAIAKGLKRETSVKKREMKANPTATASTATFSHDIVEKTVNIPDEQEEKGVEEMLLETEKVDSEEQTINEIEVQPIDNVETDSETVENNNPEASITSLPVEENEAATMVHEEEDMRNNESKRKIHQEEKELSDNNEEHEYSKHSQQSEENPSTDIREQINRAKEEDHNDGDGQVRSQASDASDEEKENTNSDKLELKESELKENDGGSNKDTIEESVKAEPKQQDSHGKRDAPVYNDVIEETANKLVVRQKSKVKALVGAFETVISLQEPEGQGSQ